MRKEIFAALTASSVAIALVACGGGSSSSVSTTISGSAVKGPVGNATVTVKNATTGAVLGTTTTNSSGAYSLAVPFTGDVIVEVNGGTYTDEATNLSTALATPLKSVLSANGSSVTGVVTPLTTMAFTSAFPTSTTPVTSTAFKTSATALATQFKLTGIDLTSVLPVVTGATTNDYGRALAGLSKYLQTANVALPTLLETAFTTAQWTAFSTTYSTAYNAANPGSNVTFSFDGAALSISGTGAGGGTGTCGVGATGSVTASGVTVPVNYNFCVTGIAQGSCTSSNSSLSQALSGQSGVTGAVNLTYTYSATCAAGAVAVALK